MDIYIYICIYSAPTWFVLTMADLSSMSVVSLNVRRTKAAQQVSEPQTEVTAAMAAAFNLMCIYIYIYNR